MTASSTSGSAGGPSGSAPTPTPDSAGSSSSASSASSTATPAPDAGTAIRITIGSRQLQSTLSDNPAARSLVDQLPLTLSFEDYGQQEKIATLPRPLPMDGMPAGDDPQPLDLGYYAPDGVLVLYYADIGYFNGIARLGHLDMPVNDLAGLPDGVSVTVELAH